MTTCKKPIRRRMLILGLSFIAIACLMISIQSAGMLRLAMYRRYDAHVKDVIAYVDGGVDLEDLKDCIDTGKTSEKLSQLRRDMDRIADEFELIHLYICIPTDETGGSMRYIAASSGEAEREAGGRLSQEQMNAFMKAWNASPETSTFKGQSEFGPSYTICKPLVTADGETIALLGADMSTRDMSRTINIYQHFSIGMILFIALVFSINVALWLRRSVTEPIAELKTRALNFAKRSHGEKDPAKLVFDAPTLNVNNEVKWISDAIEEMAESMREYVEGAMSAEQRAETAEKEAEEIAHIAYEDMLTEQMSKVAYDTKKNELGKQIVNGEAEFAMVVIDLNHLKRINDTYGLECGSRYIISASRIISGIYKGLPVYRVGGDEFVVILEGEAYRDRYELFDILEEQFRNAESDTSRDLWERCSAAAGMTEFSSEADQDVSQVYRRAEKIMLRNKRLMKNELN